MNKNKDIIGLITLLIGVGIGQFYIDYTEKFYTLFFYFPYFKLVFPFMYGVLIFLILKNIKIEIPKRFENNIFEKRKIR